MPRMGQTFKGDLEGGAEMCDGGSLGPVGSPGCLRREKCGGEVVRVRLGRTTRGTAALRVVVVDNMVGDRCEAV
jgi:hypothetical protein